MTSAPIVDVLAACLRHYMGERKLTQQALAAKSGIAQTTISLYMRPKARGDTVTGRAGSPTLANVEALAHALGVEVWELLRPVNLAERDLFRAVTKLAESVHSPTPHSPARSAEPQNRRTAEPQNRRTAEPQVSKDAWTKNKAARAAIKSQWDEWEREHRDDPPKRRATDH